MKNTLRTTLSSYRYYRGEFDSHKHEFCQVLFGLKGCLKVDVEGLSAVVDTAYGLIIPSGTQHAYSCEVTAKLLVVDTPSQASLANIRPFKLPLGWQPTNDVAALLDTVSGLSRRVSQRRAVNPELLHQYFIHTLSEDWPVQRMAAFYCLSVIQFQRRWKEITGESPRQWRNRIRLLQAQSLLQTGASLEVVAGEVGYGSSSSLCVALHREFGAGVRGITKIR